MAGPLAGIKVVEVGRWVAGPSAAGILADWGADVVKLEPHDGDPMRGVLPPLGDTWNPPFEVDNRGKRSICVDLRAERGRQIAGGLVDGADVFVTNLRAPALEVMGLDAKACCGRNPRLVYLLLTGYGTRGPHAHRAAYDLGAFWARAGLAHALTRPGEPPLVSRGGMGDHMVGLAGAAGVAAALMARERSGVGQVVTSSLLRVAGYMLAWDVSIKVRSGAPTLPNDRERPTNPIVNPYRTADDRWVFLMCLEGDRHWPDVVRAIARPELEADARFATLLDRMRNAPALVAILDDVFATRTRAEWAERLDGHGVFWEPMQSVDELVADPQLDGAGLLVDLPEAGDGARSVASPVDFSGTQWSVGGAAPEVGQHTEEVLLELGCSWDDIAELAGAGVIP